LGIDLGQMLQNPRKGMALFVKSAEPILEAGAAMLAEELNPQFTYGACNLDETQYFIKLMHGAKPLLS